ncbi:MAG TPA: alpha/beta hydrolase-fold protein [Vicinamibacterales bacterium]|nr:alpha/beta hydrolase-fold protein [Vicinamibacterales bacterium]
MTRLRSLLPLALVLMAGSPAAGGQAAPPAQAGRGAARPPAVVSPEQQAGGRVTFRIYAPNASSVFLNAGDLPPVTFTPPGATPVPQTPGSPGVTVFTKGETGVWEFTTAAPAPPGAFRYAIMVDGVRTLDPVNTRLSESNTNNWSLFFVPGIELEEIRDVPHGAVAEVFYASSVLKTTRRMHVYTPPGYEAGDQKYPVFYLLHGAGDNDDAWTSVGRAGFILDNLIAAGRAVPMIVVMPAGHQPPGEGAASTGAAAALAPSGINRFTQELVADVMPHVERRYRTLTDRPHRAIAGLSMGGSQTLDIAFRHLARFAYIGVFSSGATLGGGRGAAPGGTPAPPDWETAHLADLDDAGLKKGTKLLWLATGVDDRLIAATRTTVEVLKKHGFQPEFKETPGAHTWLVWRDYLREFTPRLFR